MSQENVEIVRAIYEEWDKGNFRAGLDFYDPYVVYVPPANNPDAGCYTGIESFREFTRDFLGAWTNLSVAAEEFIEAEGSVVVGTHWRAQGQGSGVDTDLRDWTVWSFRGPKVIRIDQFSEREEALKAVGLSEQDAHADPS
jgi:ketosteroid isomerase-like protein